VRFLIDECLSVDLVTVAGESGHEAQHIAHVGRAGWEDLNVVRYARDGDFVLVTNNQAISGSFMQGSPCMRASSS
jgi:predicted nuclease of predicted toxin-antitoxin system